LTTIFEDKNGRRDSEIILNPNEIVLLSTAPSTETLLTTPFSTFLLRQPLDAILADTMHRVEWVRLTTFRETSRRTGEIKDHLERVEHTRDYKAAYFNWKKIEHIGVEGLQTYIQMNTTPQDIFYVKESLDEIWGKLNLNN
jgi:hypothetical protein